MASDQATIDAPQVLRPTARPDGGGWSDEEKIVLACRMLAAEDHESVLPGLLTFRAAPDVFLTLPFGVGLDEVMPGDIVAVDRKLNLIRGEVAPSPAVGFALAMHGRRPDALCIIHTHAPFAAALSMLEEPLRVTHMDATMFFEDCAFLEDWPGNPVSEVEGRIISAALGGKRAILLANHGLAVAGASIEEAAYLAVCFERAARMQIRARAVGRLKAIDPALARDAHDFLTTTAVMTGVFRRFARQVLRREPGCLG